MLSTTTICSGILTFTETSPRENKESIATQWPPGPSIGNVIMPSDSLLSWSLNKKLSGWSDFPVSLSFWRNWKDSVQMVLGNRQVKTLGGKKQPKIRAQICHLFNFRSGSLLHTLPMRSLSHASSSMRWRRRTSWHPPVVTLGQLVGHGYERQSAALLWAQRMVHTAPVDQASLLALQEGLHKDVIPVLAVQTKRLQKHQCARQR